MKVVILPYSLIVGLLFFSPRSRRWRERSYLHFHEPPVSGSHCPRKWKWKSLSHVQLCGAVDYTVHGILQARILEWVAGPFSRESPQPREVGLCQIFILSKRRSDSKNKMVNIVCAHICVCVHVCGVCARSLGCPPYTPVNHAPRAWASVTWTKGNFSMPCRLSSAFFTIQQL